MSAPLRPGKAIVFLLLAAAGLLFFLSKSAVTDALASLWLTAAQLTALLGTVLFACGFMIATRARTVEKAFGGLDRAYRFHHDAGVWAGGLLAAHFIAVTVAYGLSAGELISNIAKNPVFLFGALGLAAMAAVILTILFAKIKYQAFVFVQKFFIVGLALGAYHLAIGPSDVSRYAPLRIFILSIAAIGAASWIYREFFYAFFAPQADLTVKKIEDKGAGITEITFSAEGPLKPRAGQFAYFSFRSEKVSSEPHPFSVSSSPEAAELSFAAKRLGDFTETLPLVRVGEKATAFGPYGKFFESYDAQAGNVFVAGGIGITPFLSELRRAVPHPNTAVFYSTHSEEDAPYHGELQALSKGTAPFRYHYHDSGRRGHLNAEIIEKRAGGLEGKTIYLCGPAPMMASIAQGLRALGVPKNRIVYEAFSY